MTPAVPDRADIKAENIPFSDDTTQDLRLAVTMSGGVSLAVWMGGVAREINLLQQASNARINKQRKNKDGTGQLSGTDSAAPQGGTPAGRRTSDPDAPCRNLYLSLLQLLDLKVTVDVLSGTSAGGINAALLGLSSAAGVDLAPLRDLWLNTGSMDALLRDPGEPSPPSLMQGDKVLFNGLNRGIADLYANGRGDQTLAPPLPVPKTTVFITTTMLSGETSRFTDSYGTLVPDVDHHGMFTFTQDALAPEDANAESLAALALAARSSASFPGAFEPSFVPINCSVAAGQGIPGRPNMANYANMTRSHWVADGGLLANRPLTPLLDQMFSQPTQGQARRVLAFVVPDGGGTPNPKDQPVPDEWQQPLTMAGALKADLGAQIAQSIATDQQAVRIHNDRIATRNNLRRNLAEIGSRVQRDDGGLVTKGLLHDYQRQQGAGLAQPLLAEVMRQLTIMELPGKWADELSVGRRADVEPLEPQMAKEMVKILGNGWKADPQGGAGSEGAPEREADRAWDAWTAPGSVFPKAAAFGLPVLHAARATALHLVRLGYQRAADLEQRKMLANYRAAIEEACELKAGLWDERAEVENRLTSAAKGNPPDDLMNLAADLASSKRRTLLIGPLQPSVTAIAGNPGPSPDVTAAWTSLAGLVASLLGKLKPLAEHDGRDSRNTAADAIRSYLNYFGGGDLPEDEVAKRLLSLVIAERALEPADRDVDQPVEFVQVSANTRTLLAPGDGASGAPSLDTVDKLRGVELHHFAAFYKSSWRAWDWMWGRLDGCGWLVHILLDPRRILAVAEDHYQSWPEKSRAANFAKLLRNAAGLPDHLPGDCLAKDLAFLDEPTMAVPVSLPNSALFLAQAWQELIAAHELPTVADQIAADGGSLPPLVKPRGQEASHERAGEKRHAGTRVADWLRMKWHGYAAKHRGKQPPPVPPDKWVTTIRHLKEETAPAPDFARQLANCPVRSETLAGEMRTPAFTRLATKAAAVATAAVATSPQAPGAVRPVLTSARTITRTGYMAMKATNGSARKTLIAGVILAVAGGLLATQGMMVVGLTGTIIALAGLYLIVLGAWGIHRGALAALIVVTLLLPPALLTMHWVRAGLWGNGDYGKSGLVPKYVLPWLSSAWWGGLTVLGGIILLAAILSLIPRNRPSRNRTKQNPPPVGIGFGPTALPGPDQASGTRRS